MPTVPTSFVPQVGMSDGGGQVPAQAFAVQPMENLAARQEQEIGVRTTELGNVAYRAGVLMQDSIDDARTREEDTNFLTAMTEITRGQNGYLNTSGKQAEDNYTGTMDALSKAAQASMDRLQNDTQKRMLAPVLARNMAIAQGQINDHRTKEVRTYFINESKSRASQYIQQAINSTDSRNNVDDKGNPTGQFHVNLGVALSEVHNIGRTMGVAEDSAQMRELERGVFTQVAQGVSNRLMLDNDYQGAFDYVSDQVKKGNIEEDAAQRMLSSIWANREKQVIEELATEIKDTGIPASPSKFGYLLPSNDMKAEQFDDGTMRWAMRTNETQMILGKGQEKRLIVPFDSTIEDVQRDKNGTYTVALKTKDGTVLTFANLPAQPLPDKGAELRRGQQFVKTDDSGMFVYGAFRNGKAVDPMNVNVYGEPDRMKAERPKTLREALDSAAGITDGDTRRSVQNRLRQMYAQDEALQRQEYNDNADGIDQFLSVPGNTLAMIPPDKWGMLNNRDQQRLLNDQRKEDELDQLEELARDPGKLSKEYLWDNRDKFTRQTYIRLLGEASKPDKVHEAKIDADELNVILLNNKMDSLVYPKSDADRAQSLRLREAIKERMTYMQMNSKTPLTSEERKEIIGAVLLDKATIDVNWGFDPTKPIGQMNPDEVLSSYIEQGGKRVPLVPLNVRKQIEDSLRDRKYPVTSEMIVKTWEMMGRPNK